MAFWIAGSTGRSLNGEASRPKIDNATTNSIKSTENSGGSPTVASPLEELALNANLNIRPWRELFGSSGASSKVASEMASFYSL